MTNLRQRLKAAIEDGVAARSAYYASIELEDEQKLGEPVSEARILQLEQRLGKSLPPSFRAFLLMHNGWKQIDGETDLFSIEELLGESNEFEIAEWKQAMNKAGDAVAARSLVIGASHVTPTKYLLDPERVDESGEWAFLQHHDEVEAEVPSFVEWLEQSVGEYRELARGEVDEEEE